MNISGSKFVNFRGMPRVRDFAYLRDDPLHLSEAQKQEQPTEKATIRKVIVWHIKSTIFSFLEREEKLSIEQTNELYKQIKSALEDHFKKPLDDQLNRILRRNLDRILKKEITDESKLEDKSVSSDNAYQPG
jgi:hypothetical protein